MPVEFIGLIGVKPEGYDIGVTTILIRGVDLVGALIDLARRRPGSLGPPPLAAGRG